MALVRPTRTLEHWPVVQTSVGGLKGTCNVGVRPTDSAIRLCYGLGASPFTLKEFERMPSPILDPGSRPVSQSSSRLFSSTPRALALLAVVIGMAGSPSIARAALIDLGHGLIYDTVQDLTWVQDTGLAGPDGIHGTVEEARAWADSLVFRGYDDWRLPLSLIPASRMEETSEISVMLEPLGWTANDDGPPFEYEFNPARTVGPFLGFEPGITTFWLESNNLVWHSINVFDINDGSATPGTWVVRDGRASVPEPTTVLLTLIGAAAFATTRKRARAGARRAVGA
jgi:hypothetical protein